jgi:hypothetical protein
MASAFLHRTMDRTADSGYCKKWVFSVWVKRADLALNQGFFSIQKGSTSNSRVNVGSGTGNSIWVETKDSTGNDDAFKETTSILRDVNGWYHIYIKYDSTESTASDRLRFYINGVEPSYTNVNEVGSNFGILMDSSVDFRVGIYRTNGGDIRYWDGQMAHLHFINYEDGVTPDPYTDFGETDATTGIWKPKTTPSVTYGDQSVFLKFDNSANMGLDSSGQGNNLTTSGTIIQNKDTPSTVFATLNPLIRTSPSKPTYSHANTTQTPNAGAYQNAFSTLGITGGGKYYWEIKVNGTANSANYMGVSNASEFNSRQQSGNVIGANSSSYSVAGSGGSKRTNDSNSSYGSTFADGDIMMGALDLDNGKIFFGKNGTWFDSGNPATGANPAFSSISASDVYFLGATVYNGGYTSMNWNFGNGYFGTTAVSSAQNPDDGIGIFEYDPPAGYRALCTKSINAEEYS